MQAVRITVRQAVSIMARAAVQQRFPLARLGRMANARESGLGGVLLTAFFHLVLPLLGLLRGRTRRVAALPLLASLLIAFGM
jgi:hypothetical protein